MPRDSIQLQLSACMGGIEMVSISLNLPSPHHPWKTGEMPESRQTKLPTDLKRKPPSRGRKSSRLRLYTNARRASASTSNGPKRQPSLLHPMLVPFPSFPSNLFQIVSPNIHVSRTRLTHINTTIYTQ